MFNQRVNIERSYAQACERAVEGSRMDQCTIHVNARVELVAGIPTIVRFTTSDWFTDGSTVASFTNGKQD